MDGNTVIGFCYHDVKAYCKRCKKLFTYGYNIAGSNPGPHKGDGDCPICGKHDMVESDDGFGGIDLSIQIKQSLKRLPKDVIKQTSFEIDNEIEELKRIKTILDEWDGVT